MAHMRWEGLVLAVHSKAGAPARALLVEQHFVVLMAQGALSGRIYKTPHTVVRCVCPTGGWRGCQSLARLLTRQGLVGRIEPTTLVMQHDISPVPRCRDFEV